MQYYSNNIKGIKEIVPKKYQCSFEECGKIFIDSSSLRKHMLTHGERHVNKLNLKEIYLKGKLFNFSLLIYIF